MADFNPTYRTLTPYLVVPDADAELAFLKAAFEGAELNCQRNSDNTIMHSEIQLGDSLIMLAQAGERRRQPCSCGLRMWTAPMPRLSNWARSLKARRRINHTGIGRLVSLIPMASPGGSLAQSRIVRRLRLLHCS